MTDGANGKPIQFKVDFSGQVGQKIQQLKTEAIANGKGQEFDRAFDQILRRLRSNPADFGELTLRYHKLGLLVHVASVQPLTVEFAYHEKLPFVIIKNVFLNLP
jgi:hypothetical protein